MFLCVLVDILVYTVCIFNEGILPDTKLILMPLVIIYNTENTKDYRVDLLTVYL